MFTEAKDDGSGGDNWRYKTCKALVKLSPPTNQHPAFYMLDALPVAQPTVSKHWRKNITFHGLADPKFTWGLLTLSLTTNSSWLPWEGCRASHQLSDASTPKLHWEMILQTDASWRLPSPGVWHQVSEVLSKRCTYLDMCIVFCQLFLIRQRLSLDVAKMHHTSRLLLGYI